MRLKKRFTIQFKYILSGECEIKVKDGVDVEGEVLEVELEGEVEGEGEGEGEGEDVKVNVKVWECSIRVHYKVKW